MRWAVALLTAVAACSPAPRPSTTSALPTTSSTVVSIITTTTATTLAPPTTWTLPLEETGWLEVLLGAHYDTVPVSPGADDNGSGTVVLLELARRLRYRPVPGVRVTIALFGAEEVLTGYGRNAHHFGSRLSSARLAETGSLPDRMVSVDMVGLGDRLLAVTYLDTDPLVAEELQAAGAALGVEITIESRGDISDHEAFARAGVPAAFLWRPDNPAWHTDDDDVVRMELLLEDLAVLEELLNRLTS